MPQNGMPSLLERHWAESALAIGAIVIAAVSLWMAYETNRTNSELVASASWPYVSVYESDTLNEPRVMRLYLSNDGVGPAKVESFELFWKGKPESNPWDLLLDCCSQAQSGDAARAAARAALLHDSGFGTSSDQGLVLRAGEPCRSSSSHEQRPTLRPGMRFTPRSREISVSDTAIARRSTSAG